MKIKLTLVAALLFMSASAHAITEKYRQQLERSGCTQVTESQGCDINKTKAENAKAGFGTAPAAASTFTGNWIALNATSNQTVASIHIDKNNKVTVNGKPVTTKLNGGTLTFKSGFITYNIQANPQYQLGSEWYDSDANTSGPIRRQ